MPKLELSPRTFAVTSFLIAAVAPVGIWGVFLFVGNTETSGWKESLNYAMSSDNESRLLFVFLAAAAAFSAFATVTVAVARRRNVLRAILVAGIAQVLGYAAAGGWLLAFVAALPLWWVFKVQHEV